MQYHNKVFKKHLGAPLHHFNSSRGREGKFMRAFAAGEAKRALRKETQRILAEAQEDALVNFAEILAEHRKQISYLEEMNLIYAELDTPFDGDEELFKLEPLSQPRCEAEYFTDEVYPDEWEW